MSSDPPSSAISWTYVVGGIAAAGAALVLDAPACQALLGVATAALAASLVIAVRRCGLPARGAAALFVAGGLVAASGVLATDDATGAPAIATALAAGLLVIVVLGHAARRRGARLDRTDLLDGVIVAIGVWLLSWTLVVQPRLDAAELDTTTLLLASFLAPLAVPLLGLATALARAGRPGLRSIHLLAIATLLLVASGLVRALGILHDLDHVADALAIAAVAATAAGLTHPTAADALADDATPASNDLGGRALVLSATLAVTVLVLALVPPDSTTDDVVRAVGLVAMFLLTGRRVTQTTRSAIAAQRRVLDAARVDELTGLPNKGAVLERTTAAIDRSPRTGDRPALFLIDLDRFKNINDSLGHQRGDDVIAVIAERLELAGATFDAIVGRPSADEFIVLDPSPHSDEEALEHAQRIHAVFRQPLTTMDGLVFVTASVGVAAAPAGQPLTGEELFRQADIAMYRSKDSGRNCVTVYDPSMQDSVNQRMKVENELHGALDRREFVLFHQPIVDLRTGHISGFEALIRWRKADGTMVSPAEFIPIAEDTGMICNIGSWALTEALSQLDTWTRQGVVSPDTTISVNVSPRQLTEPGFPDLVWEAVQRSQVDPHRLWLEVTETVMVENADMARTNLRRVKMMGPRVALDDFGTGYSSLSLLQQFPIHRIKIDRAFVSGIAESSNDLSLVRTVIGLGESMGMDIVAEGVETMEQLRLLRSLSCDKAQGFLISHPVPVEAVPSTVRALAALADWPEFSQVVGHDARASASLPQV